MVGGWLAALAHLSPDGYLCNGEPTVRLVTFVWLDGPLPIVKRIISLLFKRLGPEACRDNHSLAVLAWPYLLQLMCLM